MLALFIAAVMLTALSCALWLIALGLYLWLYALLHRQELMIVDSIVVQENSPELSSQGYFNQLI